MPPTCGNRVESGTLTLSVQSGRLTLRADGSGHTVESGWLTLGGTAYGIQATAIEH